MDTIQREYNAQFRMQSALQQNELDKEQNIHAGYMQQQSDITKAALVEQINPDKIVDDLELRLRGYRKKWDGSMQRLGSPLMNEIGVGKMITFASSVVNLHTIMGALDEKQISKLMIQLMDTVTDNLTMNWRKWGIVDKSDVDIVHDMVMITCYSALNRALYGGERKFLGTTTIENISSAPKMPQIKKEGFRSRFKL